MLMICIEPSNLHRSTSFITFSKLWKGKQESQSTLVSKLHCHPYILRPVLYNLNWHCVTTSSKVIEYCNVVVSILWFHLGGPWFEFQSKPDILTGFSLHVCRVLCFNVGNDYFLPLFILSCPTIYTTLLMPNSHSLYDCDTAFLITGNRLHSFCLGPNFCTVTLLQNTSRQKSNIAVLYTFVWKVCP
jgi:hypothetical protein